MLYDKDSDELKSVEKALIVKNERLNIKKIIIFLSVVIACFLIIFTSFYVSYNKINKNNNDQIAKESTDKIINYYSGDHTQISSHNVEEIENKFVPQQNVNAQEEIKAIYTSDEKQVFLTFDDGPSKTITPQILSILDEYDVKATFFLLGYKVELYPEIVNQEYNSGHYLANHSYSHQYSSIYQSKDTVFQEYVDCENAIKNALNNQDYNTYLFRFPGGSSGGYYSSVKAEARELLTNYSVAYTNWNCLTGDAAGSDTKEECIQQFMETKANNNSLVVLMHDAGDKQQTVDALPEIIQYLKDEGYTFKTFQEFFD